LLERGFYVALKQAKGAIKKPLIYKGFLKCGVEGSRTPVQTSLPLAFYMLISLLLFGTSPEMNQPMKNLAGWS
jgi:hypothetical protein